MESPRRRSGLSLLLLSVLAVAGCRDNAPLDPQRTASTPPSRVEVGAQSTFTGYIRIGVVPSVELLRIGGTGDFVVRNKRTGDELLSAAARDLEVTVASSIVTRTIWQMQVACTGSVAIRDDWLARAEAHGYPTFTEFVPAANCWRLRIGEFPASPSPAEREAFRLEVESKGLTFGAVAWAFRTVTEGETRYTIAHEGEPITSLDPVQVVPTTGFVRIGNRPYRGIGEAIVNSAGRLAGVNELHVEEYLYGVVPRELPPTIWNRLEAQKTQAVAARTYAIRGLGKRVADGYDLLATTADQVYGGYQDEHPLSSQAVDDTYGVVATYAGALIDALYSSTTGGYSANSEDVFTNAIPYLRGVPDSERGQAFEHVPTLEVFKRHPNPTNLRAAGQGDFEADWSRFHRWVVDWTLDEMAEVLSRTFDRTVTQVYDVRVVDRADHGRVREIRFETDAGTLVEFRDRIRGKLQYITQNTSGERVFNPLRSTLFFVEPVRHPPSQAVIGWKAYGGGWGHGVGMGQTGAMGQAERGRNYEQILKHYYRDIDLVRWY